MAVTTAVITVITSPISPPHHFILITLPISVAPRAEPVDEEPLAVEALYHKGF